MNTKIRTGACAALALATLSGAANGQHAVTYMESRSAAAAQGTYFYAFHPRDQHRISVIIAFDQDAARLDNAAALLVSQSIDCDTRQITTQYAAYDDDGELLHQGQSIPATFATTIGADIWARRLNSGCEPPAAQRIPVAVDPPPAFDRQFDARVTTPAEAISVLRARAEARVSAAELTQSGRWGTFTGHRLTGGYYIDYATTDVEHMSYLVVPGIYEQDWSYGRARYSIDCTARTAHVDYLVLYNDANEVISIAGPTRVAPMSVMLARDALAAACESTGPRGRTYSTLQEALRNLRAETARR